MFSHRNTLAAGLGLALLVVAAIAAVGSRTVRSHVETAAWVEHTYLVIEQLDRILLSINQAESAVRGYALAREEHLANDLAPSIEQARAAFKRAGELTKDNAEQQSRLAALQPKLQRRIDLFREYLARVRAGGDTRMLLESMQLSAEIKRLTTEMIVQEEVLLSSRVIQRAKQTAHSLRVSGLDLLVSLVLVLAAFAVVYRELSERRTTQAALRSKHEEMELLLRMGELLEASRTLDEACLVFGQFAPQFFHQQPGRMFLFNASHTLLEQRSSWGLRPAAQAQAAFAADDCWALRRGQLHWYDPTTVRMPCKHVSDAEPKSSLCLPLRVQDEVLGILHLTSEHGLSDDLRKRSAILAEQLSMVLANLALREKLRDQSIRDPLTGLFNRRYTEETLEREIHRAARSAEALAVLMLDVDHFQRLNDTFGREAGDHVVCEVGKVLSANTRASDIVSRLGGEELLVVLPGARVEDAERKAQELRAEIAKLQIVHGGRELGEATISIGIALYPQHGAAVGDLLRVAATALYAAKREGRDRVVVAA